LSLLLVQAIAKEKANPHSKCAARERDHPDFRQHQGNALSCKVHAIAPSNFVSALAYGSQRKWRSPLENRTDRLRLPAENPMTRSGEGSGNGGLQPLRIRRATGKDRGAIWRIFHAVVSRGDTYAFDPDISRQQALAYWFGSEMRCYVALSERKIVGTYTLKANQPGLGSHVANAGFMVAPWAQGRGIGRVMGEHCLHEATRLGYRAVQFNFVVSTNTTALRLWKNLGFKIAGRLPGAFRQRHDRFVDVYVMYRKLSRRPNSR
jgi:L-amino acid N-acyltransferase YncA